VDEHANYLGAPIILEDKKRKCRGPKCLHFEEGQGMGKKVAFRGRERNFVKVCYPSYAHILLSIFKISGDFINELHIICAQFSMELR